MAKFCNNCGNELKEGIAFCENCGTKIQENIVQQQAAPANNNGNLKKSNTMAIVALILSLVSFLCCGGLSVVALILSIIALVSAKNYAEPKKGCAIAGLIISIITIISSIVIILFMPIIGKAIEDIAEENGYSIDLGDFEDDYDYGYSDYFDVDI
jgi:hypothetical protein